MPKKIKLIIATANPHKMQEIRQILSPNFFELLSLRDFPEIGEIEENGASFQENARIKSKAIFEKFGRLTLADDSGLEVDALNGAPGIYSARFGGPQRSHADNNIKLLEELAGFPEEERGAQFRCVVSLLGEELDTFAEGIVRGKILSRLQGKDGFGYDPLFMPEGFSQSYAELGNALKNKISHRAKAFKAAENFLLNYF